MRLYSYKPAWEVKNLWSTPNLLLQKFPAEEFVTTTKLVFTPNAKLENEKTGLVVMGLSYGALYLKNTKSGIELTYGVCQKASEDKPEKETVIDKVKPGEPVFLRVRVSKNAVCQFSYSTDGTDYKLVGETFKAEPGRWIGAKMGIFCSRDTQTNDSGYADFDWFRVEAP